MSAQSCDMQFMSYALPTHAQIGASPVPNIPDSVILPVHRRTKLLAHRQLCFCFPSMMKYLPTIGSAMMLES
jgi:hypothetical protein